MTPDEQALVDAARAVRNRAYAPYSGFRVGAALRARNGQLFTGVNVENASYPVGICAERAALAAAVTAGAAEFDTIAVACDGDAPCTPCGMCRQALFEFAPDLVVLAVQQDGEPVRYILGNDLLPDGFGPDRLRDR